MIVVASSMPTSWPSFRSISLEVHARLAEVLQGAVQVEAVDVLEGLDAVPDPHRLREPGAVADGADLEAEVGVAEKAVRVVDDLGVVPGG